MKEHTPRPSLIVLGLCLCLLLCFGCGDNEKGACVRNPGEIIATCGDDFTAYQCDQVGGTLYLDQTCEDLGFGTQ